MSQIASTKICRHCKPPREKPLAEFAITNRSLMNRPEGRKEICKTCAWDVEIERRKQAMSRVATERVDIPERLLNHRKKFNLTQEQEAKRLGIPLGTYITYEKGRRGRRLNEKMYRHIIEQTADNMDEPTTELTAGQKAARTRKRRAAAAKAVKTRRRRAAGKKAAQTRKRRAAGRKAAATRKARRSSRASEEISS